MAKQKKKAARAGRRTGAIRVKPRRSAYAAGRTRRAAAGAPVNEDTAADIDAQLRRGEALRADIERRIEAGLVGY